MKIIALSDLHGKTKTLPLLTEYIKAADLVLLCGDITHFGRGPEIAGIINTLRQMNPQILAVSGNCDYPQVEVFLQAEKISLNANVVRYGQFAFAGLSGSLPCPGKTPNEYSEEEYEILLGNLEMPPDLPLILVSHQPPYGTLNDQVSPGVHVGSKVIRQFIERRQPLICFTGHIHEGIGIDYIGHTVVINAGPAGAGNYAVAETEGITIKNTAIRNHFNR